jgi:two-component system OmpR family response regulator
MIKILLIEDDPELAMILSNYLKQHEMSVTWAEDPYMGLSHLTQDKFDLIILDLTLPEMDGLELILKIREVTPTPIIISSARDDLMDKIIGLERGADDYMPKPYDPRELVSRIKTILRRTTKTEVEQSVQKDKFILNDTTREVLFQDNILELTAAEYDLFSILHSHKNTSVSREQLQYDSEHISDSSSVKNVDVIISRIRSKIGQIDRDKTYIKQIRGVGYMLVDK